MAATASRPAGVARQLVDPRHLWIRYRPTSWPSSEALRIDFSRARLLPSSSSGERAEINREPLLGLDDVVYLPVVDPSLDEARLRMAEAMHEKDVPFVLQLLPEDSASGLGGGVYDLLESLLDRRFEALEALPEGCAAVWPLIGGYTDGEELCRRGLEILAGAAVDCVQGVALELTPTQRREIVERAGDHGFDRLFHGEPPCEREFSRLAASLGLKPFVPRFVPEKPRRLRHNRELAAALYRYADLWIRLGRPEAGAQEIFAAARRVDVDPHDLRELGRGGNLNIVDWLGKEARPIVEELTTTGRSPRLDALMKEYLAPIDRSDDQPGPDRPECSESDNGGPEWGGAV